MEKIWLVVSYMPLTIHGAYTHEDGAKEAIAKSNLLTSFYIIEVDINKPVYPEGYE